MNKRFITADELQLLSLNLARQVLQSEFSPTLVVGVWRGGAPIAVQIHEYFAYKGMPTQHCPVVASSYLGTDQVSEVKLYGTQLLLERVNTSTRVLIVDDVFDSGKTCTALVEFLLSLELTLNTIKIACPFYKPQNNKTKLAPDFYIEETTQWLVFPHELCGISAEELQSGKAPAIVELLA